MKTTGYLLLCTFVMLLCVSVLSQTPNVINYQGFLTNSSGNPLDGSYNMTFYIYDSPTIGTLKWTEVHTSVPVANGLFTVILGSINPILDTVFNGQDRYLQIQVRSEVISPRTRLTASAYAQQISTVDGAGGGIIDGGIIIVPDDFTEPANAIDVHDFSGNSVVTVSVDQIGSGFIDFYDPVDSKGSLGFGRHYAQIGTDGLLFFGATTSDTVVKINPSGDIRAIGKVSIGQSSTNNGIWATSFGYNNDATGDTSTVSGGTGNNANGDVSVVSGGGHNSTGIDAFNSVIGGGEFNDVNGGWSTISGGVECVVNGDYASVGGGSENAIGGNYSTIAGGDLNYIDAANHASIGGGFVNSINAGGAYSTIGGGFRNYAEYQFSTIPGGYWNQIYGDLSFAAGSKSVAYNKGCFVWADAYDTASVFGSTADNQFLIRANGGVGIGTNSPNGQLHVASNDLYNAYFETNYISSSARVIYGIYTGTTSVDAVAVYGQSTPIDNYGIGGYFRGGYRGVLAEVAANGSGTSYMAVRGYTSGTSTSGSKYGVYGYCIGSANTNYGVYGTASGATNNYAGYFSGNVNVTGTLSKGGGSFKIDHPLDPENKYLYHSFVESPDMMNVYNGNAILDANGSAVVEMPDYFTALNRDFRYQLTCIGGFAPVYVAQEITNNQFVISGGTPGLKVSWQVTGIRQDAFANANRIPIEEDKKGDEKGRYLHPESFNKQKDQGIDSYRESKNNERHEEMQN